MARKVDLGAEAVLPAGSTLYRAGAVGASHVWYSPDERVARSYGSVFAQPVKRFSTSKPLRLARFEKVWNVKIALLQAKLMAPTALQTASNLDLAKHVCAAGYDGWRVEHEEHLSQLPGGKIGIDRAKPVIGPDVMLCKRVVKAARQLDGARRRR